MKRWVIAAAILALGMICAAAQAWPTKLVKIIVPFAAGATPDVVARLIADDLQTRLSQAFIIENRPGASGNTGTDAVAKAEPDGGTIGVSIGGPLAINTLLFPSLPYDPRKDLTPITLLVTQPSVLAVNASLGVSDTRALIDIIKRNPGKYAFGSIGAGSLSHLAMEAIALKSCARALCVVAASGDRAPAQRCADGLLAGDLDHATTALRRHQGAGGVDRRTIAAFAGHPNLEGIRHRC